MKPEHHFGLIHHLEVTFEPETQIAEFSGQQDTQQDFYMLLTKRSTHLLWYRLTSALFPHEAQTLTSLADTAPLQAVDGHPMVTTIRLKRADDGLFYISGETYRDTWHLSLTAQDAERLWATLDVLLHPTGWQGRESTS